MARLSYFALRAVGFVWSHGYHALVHPRFFIGVDIGSWGGMKFWRM